jgi:hypothetical protein
MKSTVVTRMKTMTSVRSRTICYAFKLARYRWNKRFVRWLLTYNVFLEDDDDGLEQSETISNISASLFEQVYQKESSTLSCPCSRSAIPYSSFVQRTVRFHPVCTSRFVIREWILSHVRIECKCILTDGLSNNPRAQVR